MTAPLIKPTTFHIPGSEPMTDEDRRLFGLDPVSAPMAPVSAPVAAPAGTSAPAAAASVQKANVPFLPAPAAPAPRVPLGVVEPMTMQDRAMIGVNRTLIGGPDAYMAMFPDAFAKKDEDKPNLLERGLRGIAHGFASMAPATVTLAGGVIDFLGADEAGNAIARQGITMQQWLDDHLAVENPTVYDQVWDGVGSCASFLLPGLGTEMLVGKIAMGLGMFTKTAEGAAILTRTGTIFTKVAGGGVMSFTEAAIEQSQRQSELMNQGMTAEDALKASEPVFWENMGILAGTNAISYWLPMPSGLRNKLAARAGRAVLAAFMEGGQERAQSVIQDVAAGRGEWADFMDSKKYWPETLIGAGLGSATTFAFDHGGEHGQKPGKPRTVSPPGAEPGQATPAQAAPGAAAPVEGNLPMAPVEGFDVHTDQTEPLATPPSAQENPAPPKPGLATPVSTFENKVDGVRAEVYKRNDGQFAVSVQDIDSGERLDTIRIHPTQEAAENDARSITRPRGQEAAPKSKPKKSRAKKAPPAAVAPEQPTAAAPAPPATPTREVNLPKDVLDAAAAVVEYMGGSVDGADITANDLTDDDITFIADQANRIDSIQDKGESVKRADALVARVQAIIRANRAQAEVTAPVQEPVAAPAVEKEQRSHTAAEKVALSAHGVTYERDNPGGDWLAEQQQDAHEALAKNPVRGRLSGKITATITGMMPASDLASIPGSRDEQNAIDTANVESLAQSMRDKGYDPKSPPLIGVGVDGKPYIVEGNHRIRAAVAAGIDMIPVDIRYYAGGENVDGTLSPARVADILDNHVAPAEPTLATNPVEAIKKQAREKAEKKKGKAAPTQEAVGEASGIVSMATEDLTVDPARFQARSTVDNPESGTNESKMKRIMSRFRPDKLNPIVAWRDPIDGRLKVLDGHHTLEAAKRGGVARVNVKEFHGTYEQAVQESKNLNDERDSNDDLSRAANIRSLRESGASAASINEDAHNLYGRNAPTIIAMSHLNPKGQLHDALKSMLSSTEEGTNWSKLKKIAKWIGEARRRNQNITDAHEQELFKALMADFESKPWAKTEESFVKHVDGLVRAEGFDPSGPINVGLDKRTPAERKFDEDVAAADKAIAEAQAKQQELITTIENRRKAAALGQDTEVDPATAERLLAKAAIAIKDATEAKNRLLGDKDTRLAAERNQINMFGAPAPVATEVVPAPAPKQAKAARSGPSEIALGLFGAVKAKEAREGRPTPRLVDATTDEHRAAVAVGEVLGIETVLYSAPGSRSEGRSRFMVDGSGEAIAINADGTYLAPIIAVHEAGHVMANAHPDLWADVVAVVNEELDPAKSAELRAMLKEQGYRGKALDEEIAARALHTAATKQSFWDRLAEYSPDAFNKLVSVMRSVLAKAKAAIIKEMSVEQYFKDFGRVEEVMAKAVAKMQQERASGVTTRTEPGTGVRESSLVSSIRKKIATWFSGTGTVEGAIDNVSSVHMVEYEPDIAAQYDAVHGTESVPRSVVDVSAKEVRDSGARHFHASPVCKESSIAKRNRKPGPMEIESARAVARVIEQAGIPTITIENVPGYQNTEAFGIIKDAFARAGYTIHVGVYNAADFGAIQNRTRLLVRATLGETLPPIPAKVAPGDWYTAVKDLIDEAPESTITPWEKERIGWMVEKGKLDPTKPIITMGGSAVHSEASAANSGGPSPTLKSSPNEVPRILMPDGRVVKVTPRMMARLMGMPESFKVPEHFGFAKKVLGNGIEGHITRALIEPMIGSDLEASDGVYRDLMSSPKPSSPEMGEQREKIQVGYRRAKKPRLRSIADFHRNAYRLMVDKNTMLYRAVKNTLSVAGKTIDIARNPYIAIRRMNTWAAAAEMNLKYEVRPWDGKGEKLSDGLEVIIRKHGIWEAIDNGEFGTWLMAATLQSRRLAIGDSFFGEDPTSPKYQAAEAEYQKWQDLYDKYKGTKGWSEAADDLTKYAYALMRRAYESGAISKETYRNLTGKYSTYAPLFAAENNNGDTYSINHGDPVGAGHAAWEMKTFDPNITRMDPIDALIKQTYHMELFAKTNEVRRSAADFIKEFKDGPKGTTSLTDFGMRVKPKVNPVQVRIDTMLRAMGLTRQQMDDLQATGAIRDLEASAKIYVASQVQPDGVIALLRDGEIEYWQLTPELYDIYAGTAGKGNHALMKFFSKQTSLLRAGAVLTPDFMARNQIRDFMGSAIMAQHLVKNPVDAIKLPFRILQGLNHAIKHDDLFIEYMMQSGHAELAAQDQAGLRKASEELTRKAGGFKYMARMGVKNPVKYIMHSHPVALLQEFGKLTENSTRIAVYEKTKADLLKMGWTEANATVKAAMEAREASIDFSRSGAYGEVINRIIPFFNAAVQGNDKAFRTLISDPTGKGAAWMRGTMLLTIPSVLLWCLNRDDDWYQEQPIWLKNNFWLFSIDGGKTIHKIPKPFEAGMIYSSLPERFLDWRKNKDPDAMREWADGMLRNMVAMNSKNPLASVGQLAGPMGGTMAEIASNYDSFRGTPIVKGWLQDVEPREQYNASTSEFAKWLGGAWPGRGMSPMMIDHFVRGSFGGVGTYAVDFASNVMMMSDPKLRHMKPSSRMIYDVVPDWMPVIKAFTATTPAGYTRQMNDFFEVYDRGTEAQKTLQAFKASGAPREKFLDLFRRSGADIEMYKPAAEMAKNLGQLSKRARMIESAPETVLTRDQKREQLDQLARARNQMVDGFMKKYRAIDRDALQKKLDASMPRLDREFKGTATRR